VRVLGEKIDVKKPDKAEIERQTEV